jgi:hypothetical protein
MMLNFYQTGTVGSTTQLQSCDRAVYKRVQRVSLIEKGKNHCRNAEQDITQTKDMLSGELKECEQDEFADLLTKAYKNAKKNGKQIPSPLI